MIEERPLNDFYSADMQRLRRAEENAIIAAHAARYAAHIFAVEKEQHTKEKIR